MPESREKTTKSGTRSTTDNPTAPTTKAKAKKASSRKTGSTKRKPAAATGDAKPKRKYVTRKRTSAGTTAKPRPTVRAVKPEPVPAAPGDLSTEAIKSALAVPAPKIEMVETPAETRPSAEPQATTERPTLISGEERRRMIAERAYYLAQQRGFRGGSPNQDWLDAEAAIDAMILGGRL